jgi:hypothetical protein
MEASAAVTPAAEALAALRLGAEDETDPPRGASAGERDGTSQCAGAPAAAEPALAPAAVAPGVVRTGAARAAAALTVESVLQLLDTPAEPRFDELTELLCTLCEGDAAFVTLVDCKGKRLFFKSAHLSPAAQGRLNKDDVPLLADIPCFCEHATATCAPLTVLNAVADEVRRCAL